MLPDDKYIRMRTKRSSTVVKAFLEKHPDAVVKLNGKIETRPLDEWCTKKSLAALIDFSLSSNNEEILGFHDDSRELWAPTNEFSFVNELASKKMVRFWVMTHIIRMRTKRSFAVVKAFLEKYPDAVAKLNGKIETRPLDEWCTRKSLAALIDFSLSLDGMDILRFHDDSRELWTPIKEFSFVNELASKKMVRFRVMTYGEPKSRKPNFFGWLFGKVDLELDNGKKITQEEPEVASKIYRDLSEKEDKGGWLGCQIYLLVVILFIIALVAGVIYLIFK